MNIKEKIAILREIDEIMDGLKSQMEYMAENPEIYSENDITPKKKVMAMLEDMAKKV